MDNHLNSLFPNASLNTSASPSVAPINESNKPLFTLKQVQLICETMLKEREKQLQEEYEKALNQKLSGKYTQTLVDLLGRLEELKPS